MVDENNKRQSPMNFVECFSSVDEQGHHPTSNFILLLGVQKWLGLTLSAFGTREAKLDCDVSDCIRSGRPTTINP